MERKVGERFEYEGKTYEVVEEIDACKGCAFVKRNVCRTISNNIKGYCSKVSRSDYKGVIFKEVTEEDRIKEAVKHELEMYKKAEDMAKQSEADVPFPEVEKKPYDITSIRCDEATEVIKVPTPTYNELDRIGLLPNDVRKDNVGRSNYSQHIIQPWSIILDWGLDFFEGNILKYLLRTKKDTPREEDMDKIIHYAQEIKRQLKHKKE